MIRSPETSHPTEKHSWKRRTAVVAGLTLTGAVLFGINSSEDPPPAPPTGIVPGPIGVPLRPIFETPTSERQLWEQGYQRSVNKLPITEASVAIAEQRLQQTIELMGKSSNPFFKEAYDRIKRYGDRASLKVYSVINSEHDYQIVTFLQNRDDKVHGHIAFAANEILNNTDALLLATEIVHEATHLTRILDIATFNLTLSAEQIIEKEQARKNNPRALFEEESIAYARQAEALRYAVDAGYQLPLTGYDRLLVETHRAIQGNIDSVEWKTLIQDMTKIVIP